MVRAQKVILPSKRPPIKPAFNATRRKYSIHLSEDTLITDPLIEGFLWTAMQPGSLRQLHSSNCCGGVTHSRFVLLIGMLCVQALGGEEQGVVDKAAVDGVAWQRLRPGASGPLTGYSWHHRTEGLHRGGTLLTELLPSHIARHSPCGLCKEQLPPPQTCPFLGTCCTQHDTDGMPPVILAWDPRFTTARHVWA